MDRYGDIYSLSDIEIMERIGNNIRTFRLNSDITRAELQTVTGIHKKTIGDAEDGKNVTMRTLIGILRGLNMLDVIEPLVEEENVSPVIIAKSGNIPRRATGKR